MIPLFFQNSNSNGIDFNLGILFEKLDSWLDGLVRLFPNLVVAIVLVILGYFVSRFAGTTVNKIITSRDRRNLGEMLGGLLKWTVFISFIAIATTIVLPSLSPGDLIAGLGVSSVAIGFAFKDILQNWLAGLLLLIRQPFEIGDQIEVNDLEGTVSRIETRATIITTYSGVKIVVPNSAIYTSALKVYTANDLIRSEYDVGIGYGDSIDTAIDIIKKSMLNIDGIDKNKSIEVLPWGLDASWVTLRIRWWTNSNKATVIKVHSKVIQNVKLALDSAKIDMPYDTYVHLLHDQTESTDGDRSKQREGWPLDQNSTNTEPRSKHNKTAD